MSDYIPLEIQAQILKNVAVKSLVQFRSVSKQWKSLIDSSKFISNHNPRNPDPQHLLVSFLESEENKQKYVSFLDDNAFPKHKFSPTVPVSVNQLYNPKVIGSSKGVFCFYSYSGKPSVSGTVVLWNPTIGKSVVIDVPNVFYSPYRTVIGFVVCPRTNDPKLVKSTFSASLSNFDSYNAWQVEVFSLSSNVWRTLSVSLPDMSIGLTEKREVIDGVIYWLSVDRVLVDDVNRCSFLIMSFDITTEEFTKIVLPDCLSLDMFTLSISKLRDSLVVLEYGMQHMERGFHVWRMENGVPKSFTKLFNINPPYWSVGKVFGFLKTGAPIVALLKVLNDFDSTDNTELEHAALFVYVPYSEHIDSIGISGNVHSFFVKSYTESLLLLDR